MNELSERARELVRGLAKGTFEAEKTVPYCDLDSTLGLSFAMPLIEQALLAEQQLAIEQCAVDCKYETGWSRGYKAAMELSVEIIRKYLAFNDQRAVSWHEIQDTITALRAAAKGEEL